MIELVKEPPADFTPRANALELLGATSLDNMFLMSEVCFRFGNKLLGGVGRSSLTSEREMWVMLGEEFRPIDVRKMRPFVSIAAAHFHYIRARVRLGYRAGAAFAFAFGFMWEEDGANYHYFSVRG